LAELYPQPFPLPPTPRMRQHDMVLSWTQNNSDFLWKSWRKKFWSKNIYFANIFMLRITSLLHSAVAAASLSNWTMPVPQSNCGIKSNIGEKCECNIKEAKEVCAAVIDWGWKGMLKAYTVMLYTNTGNWILGSKVSLSQLNGDYMCEYKRYVIGTGRPF